MADELPQVLQRGEPARLFPVLAEKSKEGRALSVLLACVSSVDDLARTLLSTLGQRFGQRLRIRTFTEVVLSKEPEGASGRPDGLIVVETGRRVWSALVEAKVGGSRLDSEQMEAYLKLARINGIDALVTISNDFAAVPDHHPVRVGRLPKGVGLYHWSWTSILTHGKVLLAAKGVEDNEQRFLLDELVRFLDHPSSGVRRFDQMDGNWRQIVTAVVSGASLSTSMETVTDTVANWHQECRDLALKLMEGVNSNVVIRLPNAHRSDPRLRIDDEAKRLCDSSVLSVEFNVPDAASPIKVEADLRTRTIHVHMTLSAPQDRKSARARTNWLLRQLAGSEPTDLHVKAIFPGRVVAMQHALAAVRMEPDVLQASKPNLAPKAFEIRLVCDAGKRFAGPKTFVEDLEKSALRFYAQVGQRLKNWQPTAPKMIDKPSEVPADASAPDKTDQG